MVDHIKDLRQVIWISLMEESIFNLWQVHLNYVLIQSGLNKNLEIYILIPIFGRLNSLDASGKNVQKEE